MSISDKALAAQNSETSTPNRTTSKPVSPEAGSPPSAEELAHAWGLNAHYLRTGGSDLKRWLAAWRMKVLWEQIHPETRWGAAPKGRDRKVRSFRRAFVDQAAIDTGRARATISRWVKRAEDLVALLGESELERLVTCSTRLANNPKGMLVQLAKLRERKQAEDVVRIYQEGAGETTARRALKTYLDVQRERKAPPEPGGQGAAEPAGQRYRLLTGDLAVVSSEIPDESVDFLITDPPYGRQYLDVYAGLAELAARVLKPGGSCLVMTGQCYLSAVRKALDAKLTNYWELAYLIEGGNQPVWNRKVHNAWKPILWYVRGSYEGHYGGTDVIRSPRPEKDLHPWQQSEDGMAELLGRFVQPGNVILDPCCGSGTTGVVALKLGCRFIGIDDDPEAVKTSRRRLAGVAEGTANPV